MQNEEIVNKLLPAGDKFMPEMSLRQPQFTYSVCGPFTKNKKWIQKQKGTENSRYIYQTELDKTCFQQDITYKESENLPRRTASDKKIGKKWFIIAKSPKYDG